MPFLVWSVHRVIPSRMGRQAFQWYISLNPAIFCHALMLVPQTSMYVPEPVISLSLKPKGAETPNFSRALNRFKKEDPTFKVHVDHESKEVLSSHLLLVFP